MNRSRIDFFCKDVLWWWIENIKWWVKARLTGRCYLCGLRDGHKTGCNGREWSDPDGW